MSEDTKIDLAERNMAVSPKQKIKIAVLSSFTLHNFPKVLEKVCTQESFPAEVKLYISYNLGVEDLINSQSSLNHYAPEILFYFLDFKSYFPDYLNLHTKTKSEKEQLILEKIKYLEQLICTFIKNNPQTYCFIHNFEIPLYSPLGIIDNKEEMGLKTFVRELNRCLEETFRIFNNVLILDYDLFLSSQGKINSFDYRLYYLADMKLRSELYLPLADYYLTYIKALKCKPKKCIVLDLDNTLWGGIIGEDGIDQIKLGPTPPGNAYLEFQKVILSLFHKGIVLAINSKNNYADALEVLRNHPHMLLRENYFSAMRINWQDKATNIKEIAEELNLGIDSLIFIDDDKLNCDLVKSIFPEITVINLPEDPSDYVRLLMDRSDFNSLQLTEEDKSRGKLYAEERQRRELKSKYTNPVDFLKDLGIKVEIQSADSFSIPRISQLTNRTNQFNLTTRRYTEADVVRMVNSPNHLVYSIRSEDKLGDNGIVGVAILKQEEEKVLIDSFLMSCRILGRSIEEVFLIYLLNKAKQVGATCIIGEYIPSAKNIQTKDFYKNHGFNLLEEKEKAYLWSLALDNALKDYPDHVQVNIK